MPLSQYLASSLLNWHRGRAMASPPPAIHISLHTGHPGRSGTQNDITVAVAGGRGAIAAASWGELKLVRQDGVLLSEISNIVPVALTPSAIGAATVSHFGCWDAAVAGNFLGYGVIASPLTVTLGSPVRFSIGGLKIRASAGVETASTPPDGGGGTQLNLFTLVPAYPANSNLILPGGDYVLGYHFDFEMIVTIKAIGVFQPTALDHTIGIWDANNYSDGNPNLGSLLWQKQVAPSDPGQLTGSYKFFNISDGPTLQANRKYVIAATWGQEPAPFKLQSGQAVPTFRARIGRVANSQEVFDGLTVDFSDPLIAADYTPNLSDPLSPIGYLTVNLSFTSAA